MAPLVRIVGVLFTEIKYTINKLHHTNRLFMYQKWSSVDNAEAWREQSFEIGVSFQFSKDEVKDVSFHSLLDTEN